MFHECRRDCAAIRTFSNTVAFGRILVIWYERAMPFCEMALLGSPVMSSPSKTMRPPLGRSTPVRQLKNVLLPAPLGPMIARTSSRAVSKLTRDNADNPPKRIDNASVLRIDADSAPRPGAGERSSGDG